MFLKGSSCTVLTQTKIAIRRVFDDNLGIILDSSPYNHMLWVLMILMSTKYKHMLWVLIRMVNEYPQGMFLWRNNKNYP